MMILSKISLTLGRIIFRVDVPTTQSQLILSTQGTHRITSAPRIPNPEVTKEEFSAQRKPRKVAKLKEHMVDEELDQLLKGAKNVDVNAFVKYVLNSQEDLGTRIKPRSDKESLEVEKDADMDAHSSADKEKLQELTVTDPTPSSSSPSSSSPKPKTGSEQVNEIAKKTVPLYVAEGLLLDKQKPQADVAAMVVEVMQKEHVQRLLCKLIMQLLIVFLYKLIHF
ncbi:hypothetical protein Tco_0548985 [Tanacetum coccineum]